jgi:hypothetical protein
LAAADGGGAQKGPRGAGRSRGPKQPARSRPSSIRAAAQTAAAGSAASQSKPARRGAAAPRRQKPEKGRSRTSEATRQAAAEALTPAAGARAAAGGPPKLSRPSKASRPGRTSKPAKKARAKATPPSSASRLSIEPVDSGIIEVTPAPPPPVEPEIPDLPPPDAPGSGDAFPDYEVRSDTWDPWSEQDGGPGRIDPDFDAQRTLGEWLEGVIPADAQVHFINAGREFAQGVQVTVDHHTGKRRGPAGDHPGGPSRIEIE